MRLPKLQMPIFTGAYTNWVTGIDLFQAAALQDTTSKNLKNLLTILESFIREFSLAPNVLFFVLTLPISMF